MGDRKKKQKKNKKDNKSIENKSVGDSEKQ
jgi:hypothetical protein